MTSPNISPSQISTWRLCHRKFGFTYLSGEPRPPATKAMLIGTALHSKVEQVFATGQPDYSFATDHDEEASRLLPVILPYLPTEAISEQKVSVVLGGVTFAGRFDWLAPAGSFWELGDLKTTSNLKYAKTELELSTDPQVLVYSQAQTQTQPGNIVCRWLYVQTRGTPHVREVVTRPDFTALDQLIADGQAIDVAWATRTRPEDLEPNTSACDAFGGCPFRAKCVIDPGERLIALQRRMGIPSMGGMGTQKTFDEMMAEANGIADPVNPPPVPFVEPEALTKSEPPAAPPAELPPVLDPVKVKKTRAKGGVKCDPQPAAEPPADPAIGTLYLDCMPIHDNEVEWADYIIASARAEISQKMSVEDYRLIDYKGAGILVAAVEEKIRHIRPTKLILDSRTPEGRLLSGVFSAMAANVVRGL